MSTDTAGPLAPHEFREDLVAGTGSTPARSTYVFDGRTARRGYRMNKLFMTLRSPQARAEFSADERGCCERAGLSPEQTTAVLERDWKAMLELGGSIFYVYKLAMMDGLSMQYLGGEFSGMTEEEFVAALAAGGRTDV